MKSKAHKRYKNKEGKIIPGVTTITGQLGWNKQQLIKWSNNLGLQGIDSTKYTDDKAEIGTLAHAICIHDLGGDKPDYDNYSKEQIKQAENCVLSFFEWKKSVNIKPLFCEQPLVSEILQVGGTPDIYAVIDDNYVECIDLKTGKGIYEEHMVQVAGYAICLEENGFKVDKIRILNIPRSEDESFGQKIIPPKKLSIWKDIFINLVNIYYKKKEVTE